MVNSFGDLLNLMGGVLLLFGPAVIAIINSIILGISIFKIIRKKLKGKLWWRISLLIVSVGIIALYINSYIVMSSTIMDK